MDAFNFYGETALDIALKHEGDPLYDEMIVLLFCVGCQLGGTLERYLPLPEVFPDWEEFSRSFNSSSLSFSHRARDSFTASMEQRRKRKHKVSQLIYIIIIMSKGQEAILTNY